MQTSDTAAQGGHLGKRVPGVGRVIRDPQEQEYP